MGLNRGKLVNYHNIYAAIFILCSTLVSDIILTMILEKSCVKIAEDLFYYRLSVGVSIFLYVVWLISTAVYNRRKDERYYSNCR